MISLLTAIQTAFNANTNLTSLFLNGLENEAGADVEALPNCTLLQVSTGTEYNTARSYIEDCYIQFTARSTSGDDCENALEYLRQTFDHQPMNLLPNDCLLDSRIVGKNRVTKEDERVYRADVEYHFTVSRNL